MRTIVLKTRELKKLIDIKNLLPFNREIKDIHIRKMIKSIDSCGILRLPVIGVLKYSNNKKVVIDGQHLISAILKNNSVGNGISCIIKKYDNKREVIHDIAKLNNTQKTWTDEDYLYAWYKYGKDNVENYSNYSYLYNQYMNDTLPCGFVLSVYSKNKDSFKEGKLSFRDREFSDKILSICHTLKHKYKKSSFTLHGIRIWAEQRHFIENKEIDFVKLSSRLDVALTNREDDSIDSHRDDFCKFVDRIYTRV